MYYTFPCGLFYFEDQFLYPRSVIFIVIFTEQKNKENKNLNEKNEKEVSYGNIIT